MNYDDDASFDMEEDNYKSRSCKKRESTALQQRGEELAALGPGRWRTMPLSPELAEALEALRTMKTHEAKRRHMQYIGRLMREMDAAGEAEALLRALDALQQDSAQNKAVEHRLEALREALLAADRTDRQDAFDRTLAACPALERGKLRHLVDAALADREKNRPPKHVRELFRYLRDSGAGN